MASRTLLCVEPDAASVAEIQGAFEPYGFNVESISNGEQAIEWARKNGPALILVCVEPRKVGYAICNKIKRSNDLVKIPLILTSSEETQQTFEQHKKLKSRADEYVLKPLNRDDLLAKAGSLLELGPPQGGADINSDDILLSADVEEISVSDADIMEDRGDDKPAAADGAGSGGFAAFGEAEALISQETDAAFDALQVPSADSFDAPSPPPPPALVVPKLRMAGYEDGDEEEERTKATAILPEDLFSRPEAPPEAANPPAAMEAALFSMDGAAPSPDEIHFGAEAPTIDHRRLREAEARVRDLEDERAQLRSDLEDARMKAVAQPLSREKEVLSLREIINRKEKDILDLRDAFDAKERQILDHKNQVRENERARRDLEEKMLDLEKGLMAAQEKTAALAHDKDKSLERERGLKARFEGALTEIQKAHDEIDGHKKRLAHLEERARTELEKVRGELQGRIADLEETHRGEVARLADERVSAEEALSTEYDSEIARLKSGHAVELETTQKKAADDLRSVEDRMTGETVRLRKDHEKALVQIKEEQAAQLQTERQAHQAAVEGKERDHKSELLALRRRQEEELTAAEERRQRELTEAETRRLADLEAAETRRRAEQQGRDEEHHGQMAELDRRHFNEKTEMAERHRQELDQAHARAARAEGELAARTEELGEARRRMVTVEGDLGTTRSDLRDREVKLGQARDRISELESRVNEYEDQILRAFNKLRADDKVIDRAKRALAVALTLLDDRGGAGAGQSAASSAASPAVAAAPAGGAQKPADESTSS